MRGHERGVSLIEILAAVFLISIAIIPMLELYPNTLGIQRETEYDVVLSAAAVRRMEQNINILRGPTGTPVAFDAFVDQGSAGSKTSTSAAITIGSSANYIVIQIGILGATAVSSVTVGGTGATLLLARNHSTATHRSELWRLQNPPTGTVTVVVTMAVAAKHSWVAASFRNVLSATPLGGNGGNDGNSLTPSVTISPRTADSMMVGGFLYAGTDLIIGQGTGQTAIATDTTAGGAGANTSTHLARETNQGDTGIDMDWAISGVTASKWVALTVELRGGPTVADPNGSATCTDLPSCLLVWTTSELSSTTQGVGSLKTLNVVACQDTNGNSACDTGERQVRYDAKLTTRP